MFKTNIKYIILLAILLILTNIVTGCSDKQLEAFINTDLTHIMADRVDANRAIVDKLYQSGLISESEKAMIEKDIDSQMGAFLTEKISTDTKLQNKLLSALVDWNVPTLEEYIDLGFEEEDWENLITVYVSNNSSISKKLKINLFNGPGAKVVPLSIIDGKTAEKINERMTYNVYVLKPLSEEGDVAGSIKGSQSLDEMLEMIQRATKNKDEIDNGELDKFFKLAKNESGIPVTLLDISKRSNQLIVDSTGTNNVDDSLYGYDGTGKLIEEYSGNNVQRNISVNNHGFNTSESMIGPGNDMVIKDPSRQIPLMAVRFHEFNEDAVNNIISTLGMNPDQYLFSSAKGGGDNRVYIMEYPVHYIHSMKEKDDDSSMYECNLRESNMGINLRTGKLIKYSQAWGSSTEPAVYFENSDTYLPVKGAPNQHEEGRSAFILEGETPDDYAIEVGERRTKVKSGRIVLRDYLEGTYAPGVVRNENVVVFGRKLRVLSLEGSKRDVVARYYDKNGQVIENSADLYIDDFADLLNLAAYTPPKVKYIGRIGEALSNSDTDGDGESGDGEIGESEDGEDGESEDGDGGYDSDINKIISKIEDLNREVVKEIRPTAQFPGLNIGYMDYDNSQKPLFYVMMVKKNMFDTALFSGWINNEDTSANSLNWWMEWLSNPKRNYSYNINVNVLQEYLMGNYTFELQESGIVVLDLETISKIQREFNREANLSRTRMFRTTFIVLGYTVVCYALILVLAWTLDTNVDLGFNILEKVSFGQWVAVKSDSEMPYDDLEDRGYITFQKIVMKSIGVAIIGVVLILVNIMDLVVYLIEIFGEVAKMVGRLITGI